MASPGAMLSSLANALISVVLAPTCAACDVPLETPTAGAICSECWASIVRFIPPLCGRCGDPLPSWRLISLLESTCPRCRRRPSRISASAALGGYEGSLRAIVHALKYGRRRTIALRLAARMRTECAHVLDGADGLVPVPLHRTRLRQRGFNQAAELAANLGLPVLHVLRRTRPTVSQTDLPEARRHANVRDAFATTRGVDVAGLTLVLVDDVSTTGATLEACARVLRGAGARDVRAVTAARVVSRRRG